MLQTLAADRVSSPRHVLHLAAASPHSDFSPLSLSLYVCSLSDDRLQSGVSWFCLFKQYYTDLGRYIQYYAVLKRAWEQLKSFLQQRCPRMIASLKGVTQQFNSWMHHSSHRYHIVQTGNSQAFCLKGNTKILDF